VSITLPDDPPEVVATTVGAPLPGMEIRVVADDGQVLGPGEQGELLVRGYMVMSGYYDEPELTADAIVDGWLRTGDLVVVDERNYIRVTDRKKDLFIVGGFNVASAEVEKVLAQFPAVAQVAVIGVPDERLGEVGVAFVIVKPNQTLREDELIDFARSHLANYKVPELPLNATGKVVKPRLREQARQLPPVS
jgi:acyl-CoA synthetase (AMP-forming)/AMP-acid ligase II